MLKAYGIGSEVALVPAATVVPLFPPPQVMRVIELVFGAVLAGPIPAPVMFKAADAEAVTVIEITVALAEIEACATCSRQFRVPLSVLEVPESLSEKIVVLTFGASTKPPVLSSVDPLKIGSAPLP